MRGHRFIIVMVTAGLLSGCATAPASTNGGSWPTPSTLAGSWEIASVAGRRADHALGVQFGPGDMISGRISCNAWAGTYAVDGATIDFSDDIIITTAGCGPRWPANGELAGRAEHSFWHHRQAWLSADGQHLYFQGDDLVVMDRADCLRIPGESGCDLR